MSQAAFSVNGPVRTALLVEDEPVLRAQTQGMLERNGYGVVAAGDGHEAIDLSRLHQGDIDLLMTDVVMPTMQGIELADAIRLERPRIVVIYMAARALDAFGDTGVRPTAFIEKPFDEPRLLELLCRHMPTP